MNCVENWRCALLMYFITWTVAQHKSLQMGLCGITVFQSDETSVWARYSSKSKKIHYRSMFKLPDVKVLINHVQSWARANNRRLSFWESMSAPSICVTEREVAAFLVKLHSASPRFTPLRHWQPVGVMAFSLTCAIRGQSEPESSLADQQMRWKKERDSSTPRWLCHIRP